MSHLDRQLYRFLFNYCN